MKAEFKKSRHHARFYMLCMLYVICIVDIVFMRESVKVLGFYMLLVAAILTPRYLGSYTITDEDTIKGNGTVYIQNISKLVLQKDRVDVYHLDTNTGKIKFKPYFPADKEAFVKKLKEINKDIQVV